MTFEIYTDTEKTRMRIETFVLVAIDPDGYLLHLHSFSVAAVRSLVWFIGGVYTLTQTHTHARALGVVRGVRYVAAGGWLTGEGEVQIYIFHFVLFE